MGIDKSINFYDNYIYIDKISNQDIESFSNNLLISEMLNERFQKINEYSIIPYSSTSVIGENIYNIFYLKILSNKYNDFDYNQWIENISSNYEFTSKDYYLSLEKMSNKIKSYHLNPMNKNKILVKERVYPNTLLGSKRIGSIDSLSIGEFNKEEISERIPVSLDNSNLHISKVDGILNIHKLEDIKHISPIYVPHEVFQEKPPILQGQSINTICYYFGINDEYSKMIYGPMLQGYLTQYGHSVLFKKLRIKDFQLYHFEAHFDQETNILFIQYIVDEIWKVKVRESIITEIVGLSITKEDFQTMKMFISNEYRFKFSKHFGILNYIIGLGNKFFQFKDILEVISNIEIHEFLNFLDNKKLISIINER
ncbi:hypothetical protein [Staphylococcus felis]|uniref:hypothetical protein n=2 Tax=Staphylococcus felis TaxID=46127 RepID=UPI00131A4DE3|nr:hypothetical protein [Staphylococcus felis]QQB03828.1 hypothetical protein I6H71_02390 [Staphylococcus felis]